jgi:hypothetical protein
MDEIDKTINESGLRADVVSYLLERGWAFSKVNGTSLWVSPEAQKPLYIPHDEPECDNNCGNMSVHRHGLPCFVACDDCGGLCHPDCPAYRKVE